MPNMCRKSHDSFVKMPAIGQPDMSSKSRDSFAKVTAIDEAVTDAAAILGQYNC
jgi:hypothetical protein